VASQGRPPRRHERPAVFCTASEYSQDAMMMQRCENSHRPTRQREYRMQGFKSPGHAQRFLSAYGPIAQHFRPRRHLLSASNYRQEMRKRFESWGEITGAKWAA
jgi:putative transposase